MGPALGAQAGGVRPEASVDGGFMRCHYAAETLFNMVLDAGLQCCNREAVSGTRRRSTHYHARLKRCRSKTDLIPVGR